MGTMHPLDQILQRAFSQISAEAFITDFVRQAIEANRYRGNPPASQFGIDHLKEDTMPHECGEACTVCQELLEQVSSSSYGMHCVPGRAGTGSVTAPCSSV